MGVIMVKTKVQKYHVPDSATTTSLERKEKGSKCDMFLKDTSVLTLAQWGSEKGRGVFCDNKAKEYRVWWTTYLY